MNPDKLFDYLEGRLPAPERAALEDRLMSDKQLQRELAVARQIHAGMRGDSREVVVPPLKVSRIKGGSVFLWIFHRIVSRNFARRFRRSRGKRRQALRLRLQQSQQPRRRVLSCKSSNNRRGEVDHFACSLSF